MAWKIALGVLALIVAMFGTSRFPYAYSLIVVVLLLLACAEINLGRHAPWLTFVAFTLAMVGLFGAVIEAGARRPAGAAEEIPPLAGAAVLTWVLGSYLLSEWWSRRKGGAAVANEIERVAERLGDAELRRQLFILATYARAGGTPPDGWARATTPRAR
jgi:hypothetical protein